MEKNLKLQKDVVSKTVQGEEIILDMAAGTYFGLNEVGTRIWQGLRKDVDAETMASEIATEFGVSKEQVLTDIAELVGELRTNNVIK